MANIKRANTQGITKTGTAVPDVPDAPSVSATNVGTSRAFNNGAATVTVTQAVTGGAPSSYTVTSSPGSFTASGTSPVTVTGLQSATAYTFTATGTNATATGPASVASNSITATTVPQAPTIGTFTDGGTGTTGTLSFTANATGGSAITNYKVSTDNVTFTALSPAQTSSPLSLSGLSVGTATYYIKAVNTNGDSAASSGVSGTVITPSSYESIATATGTGSSGVITFSSIPSTYKHLQLRMMEIASNTNDANTLINFNGDTSSSLYGYHFLYGDGSTVTASAGSNTSYIYANFAVTSNTYPTVAIVDIIDYASTTKNKTVRSFSGEDRNGTSGGARVTLQSGLWRNTNAINSITLTLEGGSTNFATTTKIALYGIKG